MSAQRSMTDEQMLAKYGYDIEPFEGPEGQRAIWKHPNSDNILSGRWHYAPRPECIPSRDPLPWTFWRDALLWHAPTRVTIDARFKPRPEFARPPVNPILSALHGTITPYQIAYVLNQCDSWDYLNSRGLVTVTPEQVGFARKVLTRLAALTPVSS